MRGLFYCAVFIYAIKLINNSGHLFTGTATAADYEDKFNAKSYNFLARIFFSENSALINFGRTMKLKP